MADPVLSTMLYAFGATIREVGGRPTMALAADVLEGASELTLSSVLGLPSSSWLWVGGYELQYVDLDTNLGKVLLNKPLFKNFPRGTPVVSSTRRILPTAYELFWAKSPRFKDHYQTW